MTTQMTMPETFERRAAPEELTTQLILAEEAFLRRIARGLGCQSADVNDLVQETMLRAYQARRRFVAGTSIRAWLTTILRRLFLTRMRTERRRGTRTNTESGELFWVADESSEVEAAPEGPEYLDRILDRVDEDVKHAFERLPGEYRELFLLLIRDGLSYREIATRLSIPVGTVMSRMYRARLQIQATVGQRKIA